MAERKPKRKTSRSKKRGRKTGARPQKRPTRGAKKQRAQRRKPRATRAAKVSPRKKKRQPKPRRLTQRAGIQFARNKDDEVIGYAQLYKISPASRASYIDGLARVSNGLNTAFETDKRTQIKILIEGKFKVKVGSGQFAGNSEAKRSWVAVIPSFQRIDFIESQSGSINFLDVLQTFGGFLYDELKIVPEDMKKVRQGTLAADAARREIYGVSLISKLNFEVEQ